MEGETEASLVIESAEAWHGGEYDVKVSNVSGASLSATAIIEVTPGWVRWPVEEGGNGHWYRLTSHPTDAAAARDEAAMHGGTLIAINSEEEQDFLNRVFLSSGMRKKVFWIGLVRARGFRWPTQEPLTYTNWNDDHPVADTTLVDVAINLDQLGKWLVTAGWWSNNEFKDGPYRGIIETTVEPSAAPTIDEHPGSQDLLAGETLRLAVSAAGGESVQWRVNGVPIPGATQAIHEVGNVGVWDAGEYDVVVSGNGTASISRRAAVHVWTHRIEGASGPRFYSLTAGWNNWRRLELEAVHAGGHLVSIDGSDESDFVRQFVVSGRRTEHLFVGLTDEAVEGKFAWSDGTPLTFTLWSAAEPNDYQKAEDYVEMRFESDAGGLWNDIKLTSIRGAFRPVLQPGIIELRSAPRGTRPFVSVATVSGPVVPGDELVLGGEAFSADVVSYQWFRDGEAVSGATSATLDLGTFEVDEAGSYTLEALNANGTSRSEPVEVAAVLTPVMRSEPGARLLAPGETLMLSVEVAGAGPFTYLWQRNGEELVDGGRVSGAGTSELVITDAELTDGGSYSVVVSNAAGAVESEVAVVRIVLPDVDFTDGFADAGTIDSASGIGRADSTGATLETGEPEHAGKPGGASMWLRWTAPESGLATLSTLGSSFDTLLGVYQGSTVSALTEIAADDDSGGFLTSELKFNAVAGATYHIAVAGFDGATGEIVLRWDIEPGGSTVVVTTAQQPESRTVQPGGTTTITTGVSGAGLTFQWLRNGVPLAGQTGASLTITDATPGDAGVYVLEIRDGSGELVMTRPARVDVGPDEGTVFEDKIADALRRFEQPAQGAGLRMAAIGAMLPPTLGGGSTHWTDNTGATLEIGEPLYQEGRGGSSVHAVDVVIRSGVLRIDTEGSEIPTLLKVEVRNPQDLTRKVYEQEPGTGTSVVRVPVMAGQELRVTVDGRNGAQGLIRVNFLLGEPPVIADRGEPRVIARQGDQLRLWVDATSNPLPSFRWLRDGAPLEGATTEELMIPDFDPVLDAGIYEVEVVNALGEKRVEEFRVAPPLAIGSVSVDVEGTVRLIIEGAVGQRYEVQSTGDLGLWTPVGTIEPTGLEAVYEGTSTGRQTFYRVAEIVPDGE